MSRPQGHLTQPTTKELVMTASISLDHLTPVQQSLNKLNRRANRLSIQIGKLKTQSKFQINKINKELEKERKQPRKFLPLY